MSEEGYVSEGSPVLLYIDRRRSYLVRAVEGEVLHTHKGVIDLGSLVGKRYGEYVESHRGERFWILKPLIYDLITSFRRKTQVIYAKDMGLILVYAGIGPGSLVVEGGTGSGFLTAMLAYHVRPSGRVYSYEIREEFLKLAKRNLESAGLLEYVELKNKDITEGIDEVGVDAVVLDLATPWKAVPHAHRSLKGGGVFVSFSPTIEQVVKTSEALSQHGFIDVWTIEALVREYKVKKGETRPEMRMIGHTGYITFARKILD